MSLQPHHERELVSESAIAKTVIAERGYRSVTADEALAAGFAPYQARAGLLIPQWTLAGCQVGYLLKPHEPRIPQRGKKALKYEAPDGSVPHFDIHPAAHHVLEDVTVPLTFTEGNKKADAAWSRGIPTISVTGVWIFLRGRVVVPDLDEIALQHRRVRIIFDSDVMRKPSVEEALLRLAAVLDRRGAVVSLVYLPEAHDGSKVGLDDWFARGGIAEDLDDLEVPFTSKQGPGVWWHSHDEEDLKLSTALRHLIFHPEYSLNDIRLAAQLAIIAHEKRSKRKTLPDGSVSLSAAEIANDYRPRDVNGLTIDRNPSGSKPLMARRNVRPLMKKAIERGIVEAKPITVRRGSNGTSYDDTEYVIRPKDTVAQELSSWVRYQPEEPKQRKHRTKPAECPHCGEIHQLHRRDFCSECGTQIGETKIITPDPVPDDAPENEGVIFYDTPPTDTESPPTSKPSPSLSSTSVDDVTGAHHNEDLGGVIKYDTPPRDKPGYVNGWAAKGLDDVLAGIRASKRADA